MICSKIRLCDAVAYICRSGRRPSCSVPGCSARAEYQCDYPLRGTSEGRTCAKYLCQAHSKRQKCTAPPPFEELRDYCPAHDALAKGEP